VRDEINFQEEPEKEEYAPGPTLCGMAKRKNFISALNSPISPDVRESGVLSF